MYDDTAEMHALDRLRSFFVSAFGFGLGLLFWLVVVRINTRHARPAVADTAPDAAWAGFWAAVWGILLTYGAWRYLIQPLVLLHRHRGASGALSLLGAVAQLSLPFGLICGMILTPLGADLPLAVEATLVLALIWGWDWMKARSQARLQAAL